VRNCNVLILFLSDCVLPCDRLRKGRLNFIPPEKRRFDVTLLSVFSSDINLNLAKFVKIVIF
jgi:hypothetical protein